MLPLLTAEDALGRLFAALTEQTFQVEFGIADPPLTDYLSGMLLRFIRNDTIYRFRDADGNCMSEVVSMLEEADQRLARPQRELHRHIGDFTLFWSGVFPEALKRLQAPTRRDHLIDYQEQGRHSYFIASTFEQEPFEEEAPVLRRLSEEFELCRDGLRKVRDEWDRLPADELARFERQS